MKYKTIVEQYYRDWPGLRDRVQKEYLNAIISGFVTALLEKSGSLSDKLPVDQIIAIAVSGSERSRRPTAAIAFSGLYDQKKLKDFGIFKSQPGDKGDVYGGPDSAFHKYVAPSS